MFTVKAWEYDKLIKSYVKWNSKMQNCYSDDAWYVHMGWQSVTAFPSGHSSYSWTSQSVDDSLFIGIIF